MSFHIMNGCVTLVVICILLTMYESSIIQDLQITFRVVEERPSGTFVGFVNNTNGISRSEKNLRFSFLSLQDLRIPKLFQINSVTSALSTAAIIDREILCAFLLKCVIKFDVQIYSVMTSYFEIVRVQIIIEDINDNTPQFPNSEITIFVPENTNIGTAYTIPGATDRDGSLQNSVQSYNLISTTGEFKITKERKLDGSLDLHIVSMKIPDRENTDYYRFFIVAKDGGDPQLNATLTVNVNITDENDNYPRFSQDVYRITVREDTPVYTVIGRVQAVDIDSGLNGKVSYRYSSRVYYAFSRLFALNPKNGRLSIKNELQFESGKTFETVVEASDSGNPPLMSQAKLVISIIDSGNNAPVININPIASNDGAIILLSEGTRNRTSVAHVEIIDNDHGNDGKVECNTFHDFFSLHSLKGRGYVLQTKSLLDREYTDEHNITLTCEDFGYPKLKSTKIIQIRVLDQNDNSPKFQKDLYKVDINENNFIGQVLLAVSATDGDIGNNGKVEYFLNIPNNTFFHIDKDTGIIYTKAKLDREIIGSLNFLIRAEDMGESPLTGTTEVIVHINDLNDNSPKFDTKELICSVSEDLVVGSTVGILQATDADIGENRQIIYEISNIYSVPFSVLPNGLIKTNEQLDYENQKMFTFTAIAKDRGDPVLSSTMDVIIYVEDANDNRPMISLPNPSNHSAYISSNMEVGVPIYTVIADDKDESENGKLIYSILGGNDDNIFLIRSKSGEVVLTRRVTLSDDGIYNLTISVSDNGLQPLSSETFLTINIEHTNITSTVVQPRDIANGNVVISMTITAILVLLFLMFILVYIRNKKSHRPNSHKTTEKQVISDLNSREYIWQQINQSEIKTPIQRMNLTHIPNESISEDQHNGRKSMVQVTRLDNSNYNVFNFKENQTEDALSDTSVEEDSGRGASEEDTMLKLPVLTASPGLKLFSMKRMNCETNDMRKTVV